MTKEQMFKPKILFVEDDPNLSMVLKDYLEMIGYQVDHAGDGVEGLYYYQKYSYNLLILDVMMPKKDGFTLATEIRQKNQTIPIIFLTAKNLKEDRIKGFQNGCDDYISKPFNTEELNLRIQAVLKRCEPDKFNADNMQNEIFYLGKFSFDSANNILSDNTNNRKLTRKESALLELLCRNVNNVLTRETALETVWGENDYFIGRSMDVFITKLRKYLKPDPSVRIANVHGVGFKLEVEGENVVEPEKSTV